MSALTEELEFDLWEFQEEDVLKLETQPSRLNASEMGAGKTREGLALNQRNRRQLYDKHGRNLGRPRTLIIGTLSGLENTWGLHLDELLPKEDYAVIDPKNRDKLLKYDCDYYIMHWDALRLMPDIVRGYNGSGWFHVIADEVHRAQNRKAQMTRQLKYIRPQYKTGLSGTPMTTKVFQYWSVLHWLYPKQWGSFWKFYNQYVDFEIIYPQGYHKYKGPKNEDELLARVRPYYVRHLKKEQCCPHHPNGVLPWLPDKLPPVEIKVDLYPEQRRAYEEMRKEMVAWVGENEDKPVIAPIAVARMTRLQQFAVAYADLQVKPRPTDEDPHAVEERVKLSEPSSKLDAVMEILTDNPDKQFVIFSRFSQLISLLGKRLEKAKIPYATYTGDTSPAERLRIVQEFQAGALQVFAGTIKAGGVGLDLFAASTVVFTDREWSPGENRQAEDRLWRAGQTNAVQVVDIVARGTVDRGRNQQIELSWEWIKRTLGDL